MPGLGPLRGGRKGRRNEISGGERDDVEVKVEVAALYTFVHGKWSGGGAEEAHAPTVRLQPQMASLPLQHHLHETLQPRPEPSPHN